MNLHITCQIFKTMENAINLEIVKYIPTEDI